MAAKRIVSFLFVLLLLLVISVPKLKLTSFTSTAKTEKPSLCLAKDWPPIKPSS